MTKRLLVAPRYAAQLAVAADVVLAHARNHAAERQIVSRTRGEIPLLARHWPIYLVAGLLAVASSCKSGQVLNVTQDASTESPAAATRGAVGKFAGLAAFGRETQAFIPCGESEEWWLELEFRVPELDKLLEQQRQRDLGKRLDECDRKTGLPDCDRWAYVEFDGALSGPGRFGHMGGYSRELRPLRFSRVAQEAPSTCVVRRLTGR
jgi:hypothetical protein